MPSLLPAVCLLLLGEMSARPPPLPASRLVIRWDRGSKSGAADPTAIVEQVTAKLAGMAALQSPPASVEKLEGEVKQLKKALNDETLRADREALRAESEKARADREAQRATTAEARIATLEQQAVAAAAARPEDRSTRHP